MWPTIVVPLFFPCRNFCAENFVIFFNEIKLLFTYLLRHRQYSRRALTDCWTPSSLQFCRRSQTDQVTLGNASQCGRPSANTETPEYGVIRPILGLSQCRRGSTQSTALNTCGRNATGWEFASRPILSDDRSHIRLGQSVGHQKRDQQAYARFYRGMEHYLHMCRSMCSTQPGTQRDYWHPPIS